MAGAGYKLFNTGDVLTAAQVNTYLQEQTVMVFADAAARTTALSGVLAEGMISYLKDTDAVEKYDGSSWVSLAGAASPLTTKGDLYTYSTTDARLAVGNDGETLVADSSATTGLRWQADWNTGKNKIINGDFGIWQRGTSITFADNAYTADRFIVQINSGSAGTGTVSRQSFTLGSAPVAGYESEFFLRYNLTATGTSVTHYLGQRIEDVRTFANQTVTFSFWGKADTNRTVDSEFLQIFGSGGSGAVTTAGAAHSFTTAWQRFTVTVTIPSISGKTVGAGSYLVPRLKWATAANVTIDTWGWQLEAGSVATPFTTATGTLAGELAACQRYFYMHASGANKTIALAAAFTSGEVDAYVPFKVNMRTAPTLVASSGTNYYTFNRNSGSDLFNSWTIYNAHETGCQIYNNTEISSTAGQGGIVENGNAAASVAFSAEL